MVTSGMQASKKSTAAENAKATVTALQRTVPPAMPGNLSSINLSNDFKN